MERASRNADAHVAFPQVEHDLFLGRGFSIPDILKNTVLAAIKIYSSMKSHTAWLRGRWHARSPMGVRPRPRSRSPKSRRRHWDTYFPEKKSSGAGTEERDGTHVVPDGQRKRREPPSGSSSHSIAGHFRSTLDLGATHLAKGQSIDKPRSAKAERVLYVYTYP